jgi:hypothetical protein
MLRNLSGGVSRSGGGGGRGRISCLKPHDFEDDQKNKVRQHQPDHCLHLVLALVNARTSFNSVPIIQHNEHDYRLHTHIHTHTHSHSHEHVRINENQNMEISSLSLVYRRRICVHI